MDDSERTEVAQSALHWITSTMVDWTNGAKKMDEKRKFIDLNKLNGKVGATGEEEECGGENVNSKHVGHFRAPLWVSFSPADCFDQDFGVDRFATRSLTLIFANIQISSTSRRSDWIALNCYFSFRNAQQFRQISYITQCNYITTWYKMNISHVDLMKFDKMKIDTLNVFVPTRVDPLKTITTTGDFEFRVHHNFSSSSLLLSSKAFLFHVRHKI